MSKNNKQQSKVNKVNKIRNYLRNKSYKIAVKSLSSINKTFRLSNNKKLTVKVPHSVLNHWISKKKEKLLNKDSIRLDRTTYDILRFNEDVEFNERALNKNLQTINYIVNYKDKKYDEESVKNDNIELRKAIDKYNTVLKKTPRLQKDYVLIDEKDYLRNVDRTKEANRNPLIYQLKQERTKETAKEVKNYLSTYVAPIGSNFEQFLNRENRAEIQEIYKGDENKIKQAEAIYDKEETEYHTHYYNESQRLKQNVKKYEELLAQYPQIENEMDNMQLNRVKETIKEIDDSIDITKVDLEHEVGKNLENEFGNSLEDEFAKDSSDLMSAVMSVHDKYIKGEYTNKKDNESINFDDVKDSKIYDKNKQRGDLKVYKPDIKMERAKSLSDINKDKEDKTLKRSNSEPNLSK